MLSMFEPVFMRLALVAAVSSGAALGIMGVYLVTRRVVFLGLVLANAATVGGAVAHLVGWTPEIVGAATALVTAILVGVAPTSQRVPNESVMGWIYAAASSATVLVLSRAAAADADTMHMLFGNLLAVSPSHAAALALLALTTTAVHVAFGRRFLLAIFDPEAAQVAGVRVRGWALLLNLLVGAAAALAVHHIGALLTFSLLTLPAMAALLLTTSVRGAFATAAALGTTLAFGGLAASFYLDLPAGPATVALLSASIPLAAAVGRWRHA
jgi:ABC-type Mn2+/Zn2+ transport system permease subunit